MDSTICQTSTVTPAKPGDFLFLVKQTQALHLCKGFLRRLQSSGALLKLGNHLRITIIRQIASIWLELLGEVGIQGLYALDVLQLRFDLRLGTEQSRL
jgi:hypothetical protein